MSDSSEREQDRLVAGLSALAATLRPSYDGPSAWLWFVGVARIGLMVLIALGADFVVGRVAFSYFVAAIYLAALACSLWYLVVLRRDRSVKPALTWTQMLVDFGIVTLTVSFTGTSGSFFTFLLVVVILEAGVLMGLVQGFVFASLASAFMFFLFFLHPPQFADPLSNWYNFLIQTIAFFFTAFISGYWNQRVSRMKHFQREILDNMSSGFVITDKKGLVIALNRAGCRILGVPEKDVAGRHIDGLMRPQSGAECPVTTTLRLDRDFASYEFLAETGENENRLLGLTTNRMCDARGVVTGLIASFTDLTEMARMRQELQQQDRMAFIGELSAELAHEIRNPVASIRSAMEELRDHVDGPQMADRLLGIALRESDHLNEVVNGFLDFARSPSRRRELLDARHLITELRERTLRAARGAAGPAIVTNLPDAPCLVHVDKTQIRQVLANLVQNAFEAMAPGGTVLVSVRRVDEPVEGGAPSGPVEIRVEDDGPGIAPDKVARIFEPFYTEKERGVGMGLAICMRIVTAHDGTIQVASRPGGGTAMIMRLPAGTA